MAGQPHILAIDDLAENLEILRVRLEANGYRVTTVNDGDDGLALARQLKPDLILLDIMMPKRDGISVVREIKADPDLQFIPTILVTAKADSRDVIEGLDAGGDDYLTKPFQHSALLARVRSMLRIKALHDTVQAQAQRLEAQAEKLASWNLLLEQKVAAQVTELERIGRLKRYLPAQVAALVVAAGEDDASLSSHRRDVTVVFCDLRGFTSFTEIAEPEEVMSVLGEYHARLGTLIDRFEGTLERFVGDGLVVVFNDPIECPDHTLVAVRMAAEMRDAVDACIKVWHKQGHMLGFGVGIARGHATIGRIGFEGRSDYAVVGSVPNLAARLCDEAGPGQILISPRAFSHVEGRVEARPAGDLDLKGFRNRVSAFEVIRCLDGDPAS